MAESRLTHVEVVSIMCLLWGGGRGGRFLCQLDWILVHTLRRFFSDTVFFLQDWVSVYSLIIFNA